MYAEKRDKLQAPIFLQVKSLLATYRDLRALTLQLALKTTQKHKEDIIEANGPNNTIFSLQSSASIIISIITFSKHLIKYSFQTTHQQKTQMFQITKKQPASALYFLSLFSVFRESNEIKK